MRHDGWIAEVERLAAAVTARYGITLVAVDVLGGGRRIIVRVSVERADGVTLDDCARVSEELSRALDLHDPVPHAYTLEVASPGLDRPLRRAEDFHRFAGRKVELTTTDPIDGRRRWRGRLIGLEGHDVLVDVDAQVTRLSLDQIAAARLVVDMEDLREDFARGGRSTP